MAKSLSAYQRHMKKALKGKMKGKTKTQRKAIFKAAARSWKGKAKGSSRSPTKRRSNPAPKTHRGGNRSMASKGFLNTQTLMKFVRLGALALPAAGIFMRKDLDNYWKARLIGQSYTGFDFATGKFDWKHLIGGWLPYLASVLMTHGIPKIAGMIRRA